jgi:hypothetical protein
MILEDFLGFSGLPVLCLCIETIVSWAGDIAQW